MKSRIFVALLGIPLLIYVVLAASASAITAFLAVLAAIGAAELMKCTAMNQRTNFLTIWTMISSAISVCCYYKCTDLIPLCGLLYILITFLYAMIRAGKVKFIQIAAGIFSVILIPYALSSFIRMEMAHLHRAYLLLPFVLSFSSDTFAYFVGCLFGKHKLAPKVSPKKTIEGAFGGILGNILCGFLFAFLLDRYFGEYIRYDIMAILALLCGIVAQVGDLSFSLIKREFAIKDYGKLFLEHGGVLDRFDSVIFVAPVLEIILKFVK